MDTQWERTKEYFTSFFSENKPVYARKHKKIGVCWDCWQILTPLLKSLVVLSNSSLGKGRFLNVISKHRQLGRDFHRQVWHVGTWLSPEDGGIWSHRCLWLGTFLLNSLHGITLKTWLFLSSHTSWKNQQVCGIFLLSALNISKTQDLHSQFCLVCWKTKGRFQSGSFANPQNIYCITDLPNLHARA